MDIFWTLIEMGKGADRIPRIDEKLIVHFKKNRIVALYDKWICRIIHVLKMLPCQ
jgi:hypothetical protein